MLFVAESSDAGKDLLVAVEGSSLLKRHLPRHWWRRIHLASFVAFWLATFHLLLAGSDAGNLALRWSVYIVTVVVVFLSFVRALAGGRPARRQIPARPPRPVLDP